MDAALTSARDKLSRADHHLGQLWDELKVYANSNPASLRSENNLDGRDQPLWCEYYVETLTDPPAGWSLIIGDAVQNMRAALDHAAWTLMVRGKGEEFATKHRTSVYFPTTRTPEAFASHFVPTHLPDLKSVLEELQPYRREPAHPERDGLWVLNQLSIADKHRTLHVVVLLGKEARVVTEPALAGGHPVFVEKGPLRPGATVVRCTGLRPLIGPGVKVTFNLAIEISIQSVDGVGVPLDLGLRELRARTAEALDWINAAL